MCVASLVVSVDSTALAYPPDNAAVLYYRAMALYAETESAGIDLLLMNVLWGKADPNERITQYIESNRYAINLVMTAADIHKCDWGFDYSEGTSLRMPPLNSYRNLAKLLLVDAAILQAKGDYKTALARCVTAYKMARHIGNDLIIGHVVGVAITALADKSSMYILSKMPPDLQALKMLEDQLAEIEKRPFSLKNAIETDTKCILYDVTIDRKERLFLALESITALGDDAPAEPESTGRKQPQKARATSKQMLVKRIRNGDVRFLSANRKYWKDYTRRIVEAVEMPYPQGLETLKKLEGKPKEDAADNPDATVTAVWAPASRNVFILTTRQKTKSNAIRVAVRIYITKAKAGQLPDKLPAGMPKDLFSGQDFEYEKNDNGFTLRCRAKDLPDGKIHEYQFKIGD